MRTRASARARCWSSCRRLTPCIRLLGRLRSPRSAPACARLSPIISRGCGGGRALRGDRGGARRSARADGGGVMLELYGPKLESRLLLGTARYPSPAVLAEGVRAARAEVVTVALRRESGGERRGEGFWS